MTEGNPLHIGIMFEQRPWRVYVLGVNVCSVTVARLVQIIYDVDTVAHGGTAGSHDVGWRDSDGPVGTEGVEERDC